VAALARTPIIEPNDFVPVDAPPGTFSGWHPLALLNGRRAAARVAPANEMV
jgi:hypothetical protein